MSSPANSALTRATTAEDSPAVGTPKSSTTDLPDVSGVQLDTPVEDEEATRRMARLNFLLEKSSLYAKILTARINQQQTDSANKAAKKATQPEKPAPTGAKTRKRTRQSDSYDIAEHIDSGALEKAAKRAKGDKVAPAPAPEEPVQHTMEQPALITGATLKDYQLDGVQWIASLWENGLNGILADEMGLGKTLQTIAFLAHLKSKSVWGPFLIVCPLSVLHNWISEFEKFAPSIPVCMYHGPPPHRAELRKTVLRQPTAVGKSSPKKKNKGRKSAGAKKSGEDDLPEQTTETFPIVVTTYDMVIKDRVHLAKYAWKYIVVDEGHRLKNMNCKLIQELKQYSSANRLILTGTPLHNNLAELWSLLNFILPDIFNDLDSFQQWFNFTDATSSAPSSLASHTPGIVSQLHAILKPFLLRRLKVDVATNLPPKKEYVLFAPLTREQKDLYEATLKKQIHGYLMKKALDSVEDKEEPEVKEEEADEKDENGQPKRKLRKRTKPVAPAYLLEEDDDVYFDSLERGDYNLPEETEEEIRAKKQKERKAAAARSVNNMHLQNVVMQLRKVCSHPYLFDWPADEDNELIVDEGLVKKSGKMLLLERMLDALLARGHKVLIFSQFTTMLDVIEDWLVEFKGWEPCRIDGSTLPEDRREQMDRFNKSGHGPDDPRIFLLSTRAGGLGINLVGADTVIFYDQDWNPQMDLQAQDRAHRIGQTKPVLIFRLVCKHTVETKIMQCAEDKRKLEAMVIAKDKFRGFQSKSESMTMAQELLKSVESEAEQIDLVDQGDELITDADMEVLLDRRPEVFTQRSKGWSGKEGGKGAFEVYEAEKDEGNDGLARMMGEQIE
ncbi:lymphoid-specific helicase [Ceratobasidium sp. AG-Ba]|nr:lymphoid-specific helicase [Ceratobasidium sp. AG-Ba]